LAPTALRQVFHYYINKDNPDWDAAVEGAWHTCPFISPQGRGHRAKIRILNH
jgi:hypothetical protein